MIYTHFPKKKWGQSFLINPLAIQSICDQVEQFYHKNIHLFSKKKCHAIEIGPGKGALTIPLLERGWSLLAIEIDRHLFANLQVRLKNHVKNTSCRLIRADILLWFNQQIHNELSYFDFIISSLPYSQATQILGFITNSSFIKAGIFVLPIELITRIVGQDGALGIALANYGKFAQISNATLSATDFFPQPKINSSLITYVRHTQPFTTSKILPHILKMSFSGRRKKIKNSWSSQFGRYQKVLQLPSIELLFATAHKINFPLNERPQAIDAKMYFDLATKVTLAQDNS